MVLYCILERLDSGEKLKKREPYSYAFFREPIYCQPQKNWASCPNSRYYRAISIFNSLLGFSVSDQAVHCNSPIYILIICAGSRGRGGQKLVPQTVCRHGGGTGDYQGLCCDRMAQAFELFDLYRIH